MNISYKGANVVERDALAVTAALTQRHQLELNIDWPNGKDIIPPPVGTVVRVIQPPTEHPEWPCQLLVFWEGGDFVPDLTRWELPTWLEPASVDGFPVLSVDTDGYGYLYARGADGQEVGCVELASGEPLQDFLDVIADWWGDQFAAQR